MECARSAKLARVSLHCCLWERSCHESYSHEEMNSANNLQEVRNRSFPSGASAESPVLGNTLIAAFCYPKQRIRLSCAWTPDPEKLQDNKCVLCEATELEVICYTTTENKYTRWSRMPRNSQEFQHGAPPSGCVFEVGSWRRISYTSRSSDSMHSWKGARVLPHSLGHPRLAPEFLSEKGRQSSQSCIGLVSTQILRRKKHPLTARNWPGSISEDLVGNIHSQVVGFSCWTQIIDRISTSAKATLWLWWIKTKTRPLHDRVTAQTKHEHYPNHRKD